MNVLEEWIPHNYLYQLIVQLITCSRLILSGLIFFRPLQKKSKYVGRLIGALGICLALLAALVLLRTQYDLLVTRFVMRIFQFAMPLIIVLLCYRGSVHLRLKFLCAGIAAMEITLALYEFLLVAFGVDPHETVGLFGGANGNAMNLPSWLFYYAFHIGSYFLIYYLFRFSKYEDLDDKSRGSTLALTVFCLAILTIPDCLRTEFAPGSAAELLLYRIYLMALSVFILIVSRNIEFRSRYRTEKVIMDRVLSEERKQYEQMKENIEAVNIRCHDLKHLLDHYSEKLTGDELDELRNALEFYDANIKTGNEVLDVVLRLNRLTCEKEGIQLSCLADGACLKFMRTRHVYSLFHNAIGNAVEAVRKLPEKEKRIISVTVGTEQNSVVIEVTNYFDGKVVSEGDTSKSDKAHHGFGTMSMRYIAEAYHGRLIVQTRRDVFMLHIEIPIPKEESAK